jgi:hypothetical protein
MGFKRIGDVAQKFDDACSPVGDVAIPGRLI